MGVSIDYAKLKRTEAALRRALWDYIEARMDHALDPSAADDVISKVVGCLKWIPENMNVLWEFKRIGMPHKHWYDVVMHIGEDRVTAQNTLDGAEL